MKNLVTMIGLAASLSVAALATAGTASAATHRQQAPVVNNQVVGPGNYEGQYEYQIDTNDRASSPYAGGAG